MPLRIRDDGGSVNVRHVLSYDDDGDDDDEDDDDNDDNADNDDAENNNDITFFISFYFIKKLILS